MQPSDFRPIQQPNQRVEEQKIDVVEDKLANASARKLAKSILKGKDAGEGQFETKSLEKHTVTVLIGQVQAKKVELKAKESGLGTPLVKAAHAFQRIKNLFLAGNFKTDMQLLEMAEKRVNIAPVAQAARHDRPLAEVHTKLFAAQTGQPLALTSIKGLYVAKGEINVPKFAGRPLVAINSAHEKLHGKGTSGTNKALFEASDPKEWAESARALNGKTMEEGQVLKGPKIHGDDGFTVLHLKAPKLKSDTTRDDLLGYRATVLEAYKKAFQAAKEGGARFVQAPLISTQAFAKKIDPELLTEWTDMVRSAFIEAAQEVRVVEGEFEICLMEYAPNDPGTVGGMKELARGKDMVAFYKDGPTACFGNFFTVPGGFEMQGQDGQKVSYHSVEAALHHGKWMNALSVGKVNPKLAKQAEKLRKDPLLEDLKNAEKGTDALRIGRELEKKYPDLLKTSADTWHGGVKQQIVWNALNAKFAKEPFRALLAATQPAYLLEHKAAEQARDNYWSDGGDGTGVNALGQMLMAIRDGQPMPDLVIDPNAKDYIPDSDVQKHTANSTPEKLGYSIYGKGGQVPRPLPTAFDANVAAGQNRPFDPLASQYGPMPVVEENPMEETYFETGSVAPSGPEEVFQHATTVLTGKSPDEATLTQVLMELSRLPESAQRNQLLDQCNEALEALK